jgi:LacI family transcriptional regulator
VAVTGFDGIIAARLARPALTTVQQPMEPVGRAAVRLLVRALDGAPIPPEVPLTTEPVIRESCGCSPRG